MLLTPKMFEHCLSWNRYHVSEKDGLRRDMTDIYVHAVKADTNEIMRYKHPKELHYKGRLQPCPQILD